MHTIFRFVVLFVIGALCAQVAWAEVSPQVAALRSEYLRLRNNDPVGASPQHRQEWLALSRRMSAVLAKNPQGEEAARVRLYAADTDLRLYHATKDPRYVRSASDVLRPLAAVGVPAAEQGAALVMLGDIEVSSGGDRDKASDLYARAARAGGSARERGEERLQSLRNRTFDSLLPSSDIETPRIVRRVSRPQGWSAGPVVLDPGHGGYDVGAVGLHGLEEKEITLDVAKRVRNVLSERYSIPVLLTRESDEFVPLARRTAYANGKKASAFVSIHVNASAAHDGSGLESYYLDNTNDAASRRLAERENGVAAGAGVDDVSFMLSDLIQSGKLEDSILLTRAIDGAMRAKVAPSYRQARFLGVKKGPFFVLVGAHAPCGLIELFFVDNPPDAAKLADDSFRQALAAGIAQGIAAFVRGELDGAVPARVMPVAARQPSGNARKGKRVYR